MAELSRPSAEHLLDALESLIALPGTVGQHDDRTQLVKRMRSLMQQAGLDTHMFHSDTSPVLIGRRHGRSPFTILLYHHYDCTAAGPFRSWNHDPYCLAERDGLLYARGVAHGRGPLAAHLSALTSILAQDGELPCSVVMIVEGQALTGSPRLAYVLDEQRDLLRADLCLASFGDRDAKGRPVCYSGSKGLLQLRMQVYGASHSLAAGLAASVPNPLWRLLWALSHIKSDQEEILIEGFYDSVDGPDKNESRALRETIRPDEQRLTEWKIGQMLFALSGASVIQAEVSLPTCNVTSVLTEPSSDLALIPTRASALVDFQLVPRQSPQAMFELIREHLASKGLADVELERLPGGYPAVTTPIISDTIIALSEAGRGIYEAPLSILPRGPFVAPLALFAQAYGIPVASIGIERPDSHIYAANERISLNDLLDHAQLLITALNSFGKGDE